MNTSSSHAVRRPSMGSRLSFAVSTAERGDAAAAAAEAPTDEAVAEIKRYEVMRPPRTRGSASLTGPARTSPPSVRPGAPPLPPPPFRAARLGAC